MVSMANPFALALTGGGYTVFLFLLLPVTSSCSQLHSVLQWFDLGDDCDDCVLTTMPSFAMVATMVHRSPRRGIQRCGTLQTPAPTVATAMGSRRACSDGPSFCVDITTPRLGPLNAACFNGASVDDDISKTSSSSTATCFNSIDAFIVSTRCHNGADQSILLLSSSVVASCGAQHRQAAATIQQASISIFHLSCAMVPSVMIKMIMPSFEQKSCHMPSRWCLLLLLPVFFLSHQWTTVVFHQTDDATTDVEGTNDPSSMV